MTARKHLESYLKGLSANDPALFLPATAEGYYMDDPNSTRIPKENLVAFMNGFAGLVASIRGADSPLPLLEIADQVTVESGAEVTSWFWWSVPGTPIQGGGLVKAGPDGVRSETLTYYAKIAT